MALSNRGGNIAIIIAIAVVVIAAIIWALYSPSYNWNYHSYEDYDEEPYGGDLMKTYLGGLREKEAFIEADSSLTRNLVNNVDSIGRSNYIIYGYMPYLDSTDEASLKQFAADGNNVFLLTGTIPNDLMESLTYGECMLYDIPEYEQYDYNYYEEIEENDNIAQIPPYIIRAKQVAVNFEHPSLRVDEDLLFAHQVQADQKLYDWLVVDSSYFCSENVSLTPISRLDGKVNCYRAEIGKGSIYVLTSPKLLSNFYLTQASGRSYADGLFAHLLEGPIIWDSKLWSRGNDPTRYSATEGPLSYFLSQESLRWALYTLFIGLLIYFIFSTQRRQRAIPVVAVNENSSLEYVETISGLYYSQKADSKIMEYLAGQFQSQVRQRYRIPFKWEDEHTWPELAKASGLPASTIERICMYQQGTMGARLSPQDRLKQFYDMVEQFYQNSK